MNQLPVASRAPDFELPTTAGIPRRLTDALQKGPAILVFYKAACPTCQFTFPFIQRIYEETLKGTGVQLWGVSQDDTMETKAFAARYGLTFELLVDDYPYPVSRDYGIEYVPGIFMIGQDGKITVSEFGFTKAGLNAIAGHEFMKPDDGLPASRPG
jgi:peroxiredoxin